MFCLFVLLLFYKFVLVQFILQSNVETALNYTSSVKLYEERRGREGLRSDPDNAFYVWKPFSYNIPSYRITDLPEDLRGIL